LDTDKIDACIVKSFGGNKNYDPLLDDNSLLKEYKNYSMENAPPLWP